MKAIFEFDAPESCVKCPIGKGNPVGSGTYCAGCKQAFYESYSKQNQRAPFCPLKTVPDDTTAELEPLTLEQLREMDGKPVWIKEIEEWAIVTVDKVGMWKDRPFVLGKHFEYDVAKRKLTCYPRKPREG